MKARVLGLDLIRLVSFLAITTHHVSWVYFYSVDIPSTPHSFLIQLYEFQARTFSFSGFTILFMTMALTARALRSATRKLSFLFYLLAAWVLFTLFIEWESVILLPWDIYPLILLGLITLHGFERLGLGWLRAAGVLGFVLLWIPFWNSPSLNDLPLWLKQAVIGDCPADMAEWAILPWLGLVWLGYGVGTEMKFRGVTEPSDRFRLQKKEAVPWTILLAASVAQWGPYFQTPMGNEFSCHVYRQPPWVLWSHLVWPIFFMRLSFDGRVQRWLQARPIARWVSSLAISRKFWLAYLVHYPLAYVIAVVARDLGAPQSQYHTQWVALVAVCYLPLVEMVCRILLSTVQALRLRAKSPRAAASPDNVGAARSAPRPDR